MSRQNLTRAAGMAYKVLAAAEVRSLPVDPLALLRRCRNTKVYTYEEAAEAIGITADGFAKRFGEAEAFTLRQSETEYLVVYRDDGNPARRRFTLAHEMGHRVLGHQGNSVQEDKEADCFASHLLCPRPALLLLKERLGTCTAEQAAAMFYVSVPCAQQLSMDLPEGVPENLLAAVEMNLREATVVHTPVAGQTYQHGLSQRNE